MKEILSDRSYLVEIEGKLFRRNRRFLNKTDIDFKPSNEKRLMYDDDFCFKEPPVNVTGELNNPNELNNTEEPQNDLEEQFRNTPVTVSRLHRNRRPPP